MSKKYRFFLLLSSAWMIGVSFRFIMMRPDEIYTYSLFDKFFDWGVLFLLGVSLLCITVYLYFKEIRYEEVKKI